MKALATILFSCLIGTCGTPATPDGKAAVLAGMEAASGPLLERKLTDPFDGSSASGNYLASQFAQRQHDWNAAGSFLDSVIRMSPDDTLLLSKAMVLAMGAGQPEKAVAIAKKVLAQEEKNVLALLFVATEHLRNKEYDAAAASIKEMPEGSLSEFILPLLESWSQAGIGTYNIDALGTNTIHLYHATLIANYMNKQDQIDALLQMALSAQGLTLEDLDRIGDVYAHIGKIDKAMEIYSKTLEEWPDNPEILKKINLLKAGKADSIFKPVASPAEGIA